MISPEPEIPKPGGGKKIAQYDLGAEPFEQELLEIPNLRALQSAIDGEADGQELLSAFKGTSSQLADKLTAITDAWLTAAREEENAA